ncbi:MAG: Holliday junction resolvase RuvX [bacterium]|jgi:putative Holliday junction resolvase|nr:Holliday junction resolvase RuvX [bacterium]
MQKRMIIKGRILAIDHGQRRIGMAISDPFRITAQSLPTLTIQNSEELFSVIKNIIQEQSVAEIVVGMPYNLKGEKTASAENVEKFILQLKATFQLPVHQWDERWSTIEAHRTIREMGKSPSRNKEKVDQVAALIILQSFLNYLSNNP